jgi:phosphoribosylanthranilate isomerase
MWVKICANTNLADAALAAELGADAVGFVFAPSKRQVTSDQVAAITRELPEGIAKVGVFTSEDAEEILAAANVAGLTTVQLHSAYSPQLVLEIERGSGGMLKVLQVVDVAADIEPETMAKSLREPLLNKYVSAVLLDASHGGTSGGTGKTFDWERTAKVVRDLQHETQGRVIVAGGLNAENVARAIEAFEPFGVDVASGTEESPGKKSPEKLRAFIHAAKSVR